MAATIHRLSSGQPDGVRRKGVGDAGDASAPLWATTPTTFRPEATMGVTLREILESDLFQRSEPEVVAGADALDRPIRWVHISELPDVGRLIKGGELILSTGLGLKGLADRELEEFVQSLAPRAAGFVVELGRTFATLPGALARAAGEARFPLIALHRRMHFVEATELLLSAIVNSNYQALAHAETISRDFTALLLKGAGLTKVLERLAQAVGNPVLVEDGAHELIAFAVGGSASLTEALAGWSQHSRAGHNAEHPGGVHEASSRQRCLWTNIWLRDEFWGRLHVLELNAPLNEVHRLAIDRAAAAVGMALLQEKDHAHLSDGARRSLLWDIRHGGAGSPQEIVERARALGADIAGQSLRVAIVAARNFDQVAAAAGYSEWDRQRLRTRMLGATRDGLGGRGHSCLSAIEGDHVVVLAASRSERRRGAVETALADACNQIAEETSGLEPVIGISEVTVVDGLGRAFRQAEEALAHALGSRSEQRLYLYSDLGVEYLLRRLSEGPELATYVETELGLLLDDNANRRSGLLETLRAYSAVGGNKSDAARALHVERRTLYHRLGRIEELLGRKLDDPATQLRLTIALMGLDVLHRRAAGLVEERHVDP